MVSETDKKELSWGELFKENIIGKMIYFEHRSSSLITQGTLKSIGLSGSKISIKLNFAETMNGDDPDEGWTKSDTLTFELNLSKNCKFFKYGNKTIDFPLDPEESYDVVYIHGNLDEKSTNQ